MPRLPTPPALALALLAVAIPIGADAAVATVPTAAEARAAVASYEGGAWRYQGVLDAGDTAHDAHLRILVSLTRRVDGSVDGEALVLDRDRRLVAASPVAGRWQATSCHLRLTLDPGGTLMDGICTPTVLSGTLARHAPPRGPILDVLEWWGGRTTHGEMWMAAGGDI